MKKMNKHIIYLASIAILATSCGLAEGGSTGKGSKIFPFEIPEERPKFKLSASMETLYERYGVPLPQQNELYSQFRFSAITGFDYDDASGKISRRDPSRIIRVGDIYYIWYTLRQTQSAPLGADACNDTIPSTDWDLSDIGYAISKDGFNWEEKGVALSRPPRPLQGHRSISTPEILVWKDKYYLYFQAFSDASGTAGGDNCPVAMAEASSPDGPWQYYDDIVIPTGNSGDWDQYSIHDPLPVVFKGKIYMYYKSDYNADMGLVRSQGLAVGDNPFGPFAKSKLNPVLSSGHETQYFRFREGIAAIATRDGHEHYTIQYSEDGVNFNQASIGDLMPEASGLYDPDAFTNVEHANGITWGICHVNNYRKGGTYSNIFRFDCDLSLTLDDPEMKNNHVYPTYEEYLRRGLSPKQRARIKGDLRQEKR
ncbi:MAG: family 43 glycosylhydrolase [Rikenellaceae bacterium]